MTDKLVCTKNIARHSILKEQWIKQKKNIVNIRKKILQNEVQTKSFTQGHLPEKSAQQTILKQIGTGVLKTGEKIYQLVGKRNKKNWEGILKLTSKWTATQ